MFIELHSLLTHDFFTIKTRKGERDFDTRKLTNASRIRIWKLIDNGLYIDHNTWLITL